MHTIRLDKPDEINKFFSVGVTHKDLGQLKSAYIKYPKASFFDLELVLLSIVYSRMHEAGITTEWEVELVQPIKIGNKEVVIKALINRDAKEIKYKGFKKFIKEFLKTHSSSRFWYWVERIQTVFGSKTKQDVRMSCLTLFWSGVPAKVLSEDEYLERKKHG